MLKPEQEISRVIRSKEEAKASYNRISKWYDLMANPAERRSREIGLQKLSAKQGEKILEIGFGTGHGIVSLAHSVGDSGRVYGIDISDEMCRITQSRVKENGLSKKVELKCGDAVTLPYKDNFFDAVFISFALELFDTPEIPVVLHECQRVLRSSGRICVTAMAKSKKSNIIMRLYEWSHMKWPKLIDCRPIFAEDALKDAGFNVLDVTKMSIVILPVEIVLATMGNESLRDCFIESCINRKQKKAITFFRNSKVETEISYLEINRDSNQMAHTLQKLGVQKGDRAILYLQKSLIFVIAHLALQKIGAIAVPLNPGFKKMEMKYLLQDADAKVILLEPEKEKLINEIDPALTSLVIDTSRRYQDLDFFRSATEQCPNIEIGEDDPGLIIYTSGTTGSPKGAILTQKNLVHDAKNIISIWEITERDVLCHSLPLFHVHGLCFALHTALIAGSAILMMDKFSPEYIIPLLTNNEGEYICTVFMAVPSKYNKLIEYLGEKRPDFKHIRLWTSGSAPLLPRDFEKINKTFGREPVEREGMSETGMNFSNPLKGRRKPGSIGLPLPGLGVRIVNPSTGADVKAGQTGEIWLKGPSITPGYWKKPEETARAFEHGWFRTGDLGKVDEDGYFYLTDRIKHIIISGGENISPKEIEVVINQLESVAESSVVGVPDDKWGEKVVAAVVTKSGSAITSEEIRAHCRNHIHNWKCPKEIIFVEELPRNSMGKVLKEDVKKMFNE